MADKTGISWCDATWSPVSGCSRVSEGCRNCWAEEITARFSWPADDERKAAWGHGYATRTAAGARWSGKVDLVPERLAIPLRWKKPRRIFVNSTSDSFHEKLSNEDIAAHFGIAAACPQHTFIFLTKRAKRTAEWFRWVLDDREGRWHSQQEYQTVSSRMMDFARVQGVALPDLPLHRGPGWPLPNVWLGVSAEDQVTFENRLAELRRVPAAVRWLSLEPQIAPIDAEGALGDVSWVVQGGESGSAARRFDLGWARSMRDACRGAGCSYFLKQLGANATERVLLGGSPRDGYRDTEFRTPHHRAGEDPRDWPSDLEGCRAFPEESR